MNDLNPFRKLATTKMVLKLSAVGTIVIGLIDPAAHALPLSATNLIVLRVGDGVQVLTNAGNSAFLDQFTTAGSQVSTVKILDQGPTSVVLSGGSYDEGCLSRSLDGHLLAFAAYGRPVGGVNNLDTTASATTPRIAITVDASGAYQKEIFSTTAYNGVAWRAVATDGTNNFWGAAGGGGTVCLTNGIEGEVVQNTKPNCRVVEVFNGTLFMSSASATGDSKTGIYEFNGLPMASQALPPPIIFTNTFDKVVTFSGIEDFAVNPGETTIYFCDERVPNGTVGGLQRWDLNAGTWSETYNLTNGGPLSHLVVDWSAAYPVIYATTLVTTNNTLYPNRLVRVTDTGPAAAFTILAAAGTNELFCGMQFGPIPVPPDLSEVLQGANLILSWTTNTGVFALQSTTNLTPPVSWSTVLLPQVIENGQYTVTNLVGGPAAFFRLVQ
jgi:hypothetical protein